ncbi:MAG TPA: cobalamin-binding protein [Nitrospirae bacterium]|nr:vitamin B12-binding protein precursor [bacterium BMS3Bbin09]HDN94558.1 cobalamin-binding protein [Nitrospirota bacterium]HDO67678.1 cobalamin-binding protein [Nitrospirota bacterium]HDZ84353.1 cobalamin-binding protein [Nitrospirota bacterium]HEW81852.1 cobalamin-binding protein [Nitrospirota bacterium]
MRKTVLNKKNRLGFIVLFFLLLTLNLQLSTVSHAEAPGRIVSLAPSMTEILFAAGLGERVIGVTSYCDYPEEAKARTKIGGMSNPSLEAVLSLKPDIVIMTTNGNSKEFEARLHSLGIKTYVFMTRTIDQLPEGIRKMGQALDSEEGFDRLASSIEGPLSEYKAARKDKGLKVVFMLWPEPLMVAGPGTAIHDAITLLGATNIAEDAKIQYPKYSIEEIVRRSPDIIFVGAATGMDMQKKSSGLLERIAYLPAVKNGKVFFVSENLYRLGPRVIPGLEELAQYLKK